MIFLTTPEVSWLHYSGPLLFITRFPSPCLMQISMFKQLSAFTLFVFKKTQKITNNSPNPAVDRQFCILPVLVIRFVLLLLPISVSLKMGSRIGSPVGLRDWRVTVSLSSCYEQKKQFCCLSCSFTVLWMQLICKMINNIQQCYFL